MHYHNHAVYTNAIAKGLKADGILTPSKKSANWQATVVRSILTNEKYKGDALLQKSFTVDFLTKKTKKNEGEVPQYYAEGSHPAIIKPEVFDYVQTLMESADNRHSSGVSIFSGKLLCGDCGAVYGSKVWHSNSKYRRTIWQCNAKFKKTDRCKTPHLTEGDIQSAFVEVMNRLLSRKDELLPAYGSILKALTDTARLEKEADALKQQHDDVLARMEVSIQLNATRPLNQVEYQKQYDELLEQANTAKVELQRVNDEIAGKGHQRKTLLAFMRELERRDGVLAEFDEGLWIAAVESVRVARDEMVFTFKDGSSHTVNTDVGQAPALKESK